MERLSDIPRAKIFPLHANLSSDEQRRVFSHTSEWKIIAATNVAEVCNTYRRPEYQLYSPLNRHLLPSTMSSMSLMQEK